MEPTGANGTWGKPHHNMIQVLDDTLGKINISFTWHWREKSRDDYKAPREYFEQLQLSLRHTPVYSHNGESVHGFASAFTQRGISVVIADASQSYDLDHQPREYMHYTLKRAEFVSDGLYVSHWNARPVPDGMNNTIRDLISARFADYAKCTDLIETMRLTQRRAQLEHFESERNALLEKIEKVNALRDHFEHNTALTLDPRDKR